jgi:hypothetical protein
VRSCGKEENEGSIGCDQWENTGETFSYCNPYHQRELLVTTLTWPPSGLFTPLSMCIRQLLIGGPCNVSPER